MEHLTKETFLEKVFDYEKSQDWKFAGDKPCIIDFYADWCAPCREEFPDLVKLASRYDDKIDVVGISVDFPEEIDSKVIPFLKKQNADL